MSAKFTIFNDRRLSEEEAAAYIGKSVKTLRNWRSRGIGPPFIDDGTIGYMLSDLYQWMMEHRFNSTAEARFKKSRSLNEQQSKAAHFTSANEPLPLENAAVHRLVQRKRRLYHRITNREREILQQAHTARQSTG